MIKKNPSLNFKLGFFYATQISKLKLEKLSKAEISTANAPLF